MFKFSGVGKTYWESSYFGGVKRVLNEYPYFAINYDLFTRIDSGSKAGKDLTFYLQEKLVNILFNQAFAQTQIKREFSNYLYEAYHNIISDPNKLDIYTRTSWGKKKVHVSIAKKQIQKLLAVVRNTELKAIFDEYGSSLDYEDGIIYLLLPYPESKNPFSDKDDDKSVSGKASSSKETPGKENVKPLTKTQLSKLATESSEKFVNSFKNKKDVETFNTTVVNVPLLDEQATFDTDEIVFARKLNQLLDINHDTKPDIVKNLLHGKMDTDKIAEVFSGNNRIYMTKVEHQAVKPFKVIVLGDLSGSMDSRYNRHDKLGFQRRLMKSLFYLFNDLIGIEDIEFYGHTGEEDPVLYKYHSPEYPHFLETIETRDIRYQENYDGPIIEHIYNTTRAKTSSPVLLISLSDGQPSGCNYGGKKATDNMKKIMEKIKRDNFVTVGIGILFSHDTDLYQYYVEVKELDNPSTVSQVINRAVKENLVIED